MTSESSQYPAVPRMRRRTDRASRARIARAMQGADRADSRSAKLMSKPDRCPPDVGWAPAVFRLCIQICCRLNLAVSFQRCQAVFEHDRTSCIAAGSMRVRCARLRHALRARRKSSLLTRHLDR